MNIAYAREPDFTGQGIEKRRVLELLRSRLDLERSSFIPWWRDLSEFILPRAPRFFITDVNRGDPRTFKILDTTATIAQRVLSAGMMSGMSNPAQPWFEMGTIDDDFSEYGPMKTWLAKVTEWMRTTLLVSNFYTNQPIMYDDTGTFGTTACLMEENFDTVCHFTHAPIGSYMLSVDEFGRVTAFVREFRMSVRQIVMKFGVDRSTGNIDWSNISERVQSLWEKFQYEEWIDVIHVIRPNPVWDPRRAEAKYKKFESVYYEKGVSSTTSADVYTIDPNKFLRESGYDYFPVLAPRWRVTGEDSYGTSCPGMIALPDVKQLQTGEKKSLQAIEKMVNPPMKGPSALAMKRPSILPGDITYIDERDGQRGFTPVHEVKFDVDKLELKQERCRGRIEEAYFKNIMLMVSEKAADPQKTAYEVARMNEEKFLMLGPVLDQFNQAQFDPMFRTLFAFGVRQRAIPRPPPEFFRMRVPLKVRYISVMARAQKLAGVGSVERFTQFITSTAEAVPNAQIEDNVDFDELSQHYGDMTSMPPGILRAPKIVQRIRAQRQRAIQAQQQAEQAQAMASAAQKLSQTDTGGDNALTRILDSNQAGNAPPALAAPNQ